MRLYILVSFLALGECLDKHKETSPPRKPVFLVDEIYTSKTSFSYKLPTQAEKARIQKDRQATKDSIPAVFNMVGELALGRAFETYDSVISTGKHSPEEIKKGKARVQQKSQEYKKSTFSQLLKLYYGELAEFLILLSGFKTEKDLKKYSSDLLKNTATLTALGVNMIGKFLASLEGSSMEDWEYFLILDQFLTGLIPKYSIEMINTEYAKNSFQMA